MVNTWGPTMKNITCALCLIGALSSCGIGNSAGSSAGSSTSASSAGSGSSAGIFGRRNRSEQTKDATINEDGKTLIAVVRQARFERTRDGGIIRATGIASRQGYYDAELISPTDFVPNDKGVLTLEFRAKEPKFQTNILNERSREIDVGVFVSNRKLAAARSIRIVGRQNQVSIRR